jgi:hypothetical protein
MCAVMRIERKGPVAKLTPRLERFFVEALGGEPLDAIQHPEARKADFRCLRGLLAIELKSLEQDGSERMDNLARELSERPDWPVFYGSVQDGLGKDALADAVFRALRDGRMRVFPHHMEWVVGLIGPERAAECASLPSAIRRPQRLLRASGVQLYQVENE